RARRRRGHVENPGVHARLIARAVIRSDVNEHRRVARLRLIETRSGPELEIVEEHRVVARLTAAAGAWDAAIRDRHGDLEHLNAVAGLLEREQIVHAARIHAYAVTAAEPTLVPLLPGVRVTARAAHRIVTVAVLVVGAAARVVRKRGAAAAQRRR